MKQLSAEMITDSYLPVDLELSPDGSQVAYALTSVGQKDEHPISSVWIVNSDGSREPRQFTQGLFEERHPRWSPNGKSIAFLSDRCKRGTLGVHLISVDGGESRPLTCAKMTPPILDFAWAPDGSSIAFTCANERPDKSRKENDVKVIGKELDYARLRQISIISGEVRNLVEVGKHVRDFSWSSDGKKIAYVLQQTPEEESESLEVALECMSLEGRNSYHLCSFPSLIGSPVWSADSRSIYFLGPLNQQASRQVYAVSSEGGEPRRATPWEDSCAGALLKSGGDLPAVLEWRGVGSRLHLLDNKTHDLKLLIPVSQDEKDLDLSYPATALKDKEVSFASVKSAATQPWEVWSGTEGGSSGRDNFQEITNHNSGLKEVSFGNQEPFQWKAPDGLSLDGFLIWPPGRPSSAPLPTVVFVHGGPYGRYTSGLHLSWGDWGQWLATAGYLVLMINPRGGSGHGEKFAATVKGDVGGHDYEDVMAAVDAAIARGFADPNKLAIGGWSQGGFMTACAVTKTNRFRAAIMGAGISDWETLVATSNVPGFERDLTGRAPWDEVVAGQKIAYSPIKFARNVKTPVLILHGEKDDRIPLGQAVGFYRALKENHVETEFVIYPRERHAILERAHQLDMLSRVRSWCDRWLGLKEGEEVEV
jgi:dipeptidyl aminopeptidase/acylaminoacyl peptidase